MYAGKPFSKRRDAMKLFDDLKSNGRPCQVYRHTWISDFSTRGTVEVVASANMFDPEPKINQPQPPKQVRRPVADWQILDF